MKATAFPTHASHEKGVRNAGRLLAKSERTACSERKPDTGEPDPPCFRGAQGSTFQGRVSSHVSDAQNCHYSEPCPTAVSVHLANAFPVLFQVQDANGAEEPLETPDLSSSFRTDSNDGSFQAEGRGKPGGGTV